MGELFSMGAEKDILAWRRDKECAKETLQVKLGLIIAVSGKGLRQPLDCFSASQCVPGPGSMEMAACWESWDSFPGCQWDTCRFWGGDGCVWCLGAGLLWFGMWGSAGQGGLICSLRIKPQKSFDGTGLWHCKPDDSLWISNEWGNKEVQPVEANVSVNN